MNRRDFLKGVACVGAIAPMAGKSVAGVGQAEAAGQGKDLGKAKALPPGRYDEHIHIHDDDEPEPEAFATRMAEAGMAGG